MKKNFLTILIFTLVSFSAWSVDELLYQEFSNNVKNGNFADALAIFHKITESENETDILNILEQNPDFLKGLTIEQISIPKKTIAGKPFTQPFGIKAFFVVNGKKAPLANIPFVLEYPSQTEDGNFTPAYKILKTDNEGKLNYTADIFKKPINAKIRFALNIFPQKEINTKPAEYSTQFANSKNIVSTFACKAGAVKKTGLRASIAIMDFNENGKPHSKSTTATTLLGELLRRGYWGAGIYETRYLISDDDDAVLNDTRNVFSGNVYDFIFGRVKILELKEANGQWKCKARISLKFWDFKKDKLKKEVIEETVALGKNKWEAVHAVRKKFAVEILPDIIEFGYEFN
ncbi:MAG: hypothetical protein CR988_04280 [Treponema sp.]|nr:MAG: hypothetical protein CR988_04280 [Treponema sp.]